TSTGPLACHTIFACRRDTCRTGILMWFSKARPRATSPSARVKRCVFPPYVSASSTSVRGRTMIVSSPLGAEASGSVERAAAGGGTRGAAAAGAGGDGGEAAGATGGRLSSIVFASISCMADFGASPTRYAVSDSTLRYGVSFTVLDEPSASFKD